MNTQNLFKKVLVLVVVLGLIATPVYAKPVTPKYSAFTPGSTVSLQDNMVVVESAEGNFIAAERITAENRSISLANGNVHIIFESTGEKYLGMSDHFVFIANDGSKTSGPILSH